MMRWVGWGLAALAGLVLVAVLGLWLLLDRVDLAGFAGRRATAALGREVSFGAVHVTPGRWLKLEVRDARMANAPGGSRPQMAQAASATTEIEAWPLLRGTLVLRNTVVTGLDVLLERIADQGPNWHLKPEAPKPPDPNPVRDGGFPALLGLRVQGQVVVRTSSGTPLPVGLEDVVFTAPSVDQPTRLAGGLSYKGVPFRLDSQLGSIAQYRDAATPFPARFELVSGDTSLRYDGTMTDPLNFDGVDGQLQLQAATPEVLAKVAGAEPPFKRPVRLEGHFTHAGAAWQLQQARGAVGSSAILDATARLEEGQRPTENGPLAPDRIGLAVQFDQLDVDGLRDKGQKSDDDDLSLKVDPNPSTLLALKLMARGVTYEGVRFSAVQAEGSQTAGELAVQKLSLSYQGGTLAGSGKVVAVKDGGQVSAELRVAGLEVQALRGLFGTGSLPLAGRINGQAIVTAEGPALTSALRASRASIVLTMAGGSVSRQIVQLGSTDIRALFGKAEGTVPVSCVLGVVDIRNGIGTVSPVRLRTAEGTIAGHGTVDLVRRRLDLTVASEARSTGLLALDVPVRVSGPFADPSFAPAQLSAAGRAQAASGDEIGRLLPALQGLARSSPCLERR